MTSVAVAPSAVTVVPDSTINMVAIVTAVGGANEGVTWGIDTTSATAGVTISGSGVLTIPADIEGTITVTATSVFDNSKSGTAEVEVVSVGQAPILLEPYLNADTGHMCARITGLKSSDIVAVEVVAAYGIDTTGTYDTWEEIPVEYIAVAGGYRVGSAGSSLYVYVHNGISRDITTSRANVGCVVYFRITINGTETVTTGTDFDL